MKFMKSVQRPSPSVANDNLKDLKPFTGKGAHSHSAKTASPEAPPVDISENAKVLNEKTPPPESSNTAGKTTESAGIAAKSVAQAMAKMPVLPIVVSKDSKDVKKIEEKLSDPKASKFNFIHRPAVIFIEGFSAFGISNGDGIKDMADNFPGAKRFSWDEHDKIIDEIKKHAPDRPVVLVGHSFGADTAVEVSSTLNNVKNAFRPVDLLVSIDSVGMNHSIIPINVKRNLNFFGEGVIPFLHGEPNVARNTDYTDVINELRPELHSKMEDSSEVQYKIFESINEVLAENDQPDVFEEMQKNTMLVEIIGNLPRHWKQ
jgi:pimeloyl-ACP methyl ester carboxylesterase